MDKGIRVLELLFDLLRFCASVRWVCSRIRISQFHCITLRTNNLLWFNFSSRSWWRLRSLGQYAVSLAWSVMCFHQAWALLLTSGNTEVRGFEFCNGFLQVCATLKTSVFRCVCFFSRPRRRLKFFDRYARSLAGLVIFFHQTFALLPCGNTGVRGF